MLHEDERGRQVVRAVCIAYVWPYGPLSMVDAQDVDTLGKLGSPDRRHFADILAARRPAVLEVAAAPSPGVSVSLSQGERLIVPGDTRVPTVLRHFTV